MKPINFWQSATRNIAEPAGVSPAPEPAPAPVEPAPAPVAPAADLSFIPTDFHKDGAPDLGAFTSHYQELVARDAQRAQAQAAIPEEFAFALPADFAINDIPGAEGFTLALEPDDPAFKPLYGDLGQTLKKWATDGIPATAGADLMATLTRYEAVQYATAVEALKKDMGALGSPSQVEARVSTIARALETRLPADEAAALKSMAQNSKAILALERLLSPARSMTAPTPAPPGADTANMKPADKLALANQQPVRGR